MDVLDRQLPGSDALLPENVQLRYVRKQSEMYVKFKMYLPKTISCDDDEMSHLKERLREDLMASSRFDLTSNDDEVGGKTLTVIHISRVDVLVMVKMHDEETKRPL